jgi:hypothetical protein
MTNSSKRRRRLAGRPRIRRLYVWALKPWYATRLTNAFGLCAVRSLSHATCRGVVKGRRPNEGWPDGPGGHFRVDSLPCRPVAVRVRAGQPSTMESRYSSAVIPLACAWAWSRASTSGLRFRVTAMASSMVQCTPAFPGAFMGMLCGYGCYWSVRWAPRFPGRVFKPGQLGRNLQKVSPPHPLFQRSPLRRSVRSGTGLRSVRRYGWGAHPAWEANLLRPCAPLKPVPRAVPAGFAGE